MDPSRCMWVLILVFLSGLLRCIEASFENVNEARLKSHFQDAGKNAEKIIELAENPRRLFNSVRVLTILAELSATAICVLNLPTAWFSEFPLVTGISLSLAILAIFALIFAVYIPKRFSDLYATDIIIKTSGFVLLIYYIGLPFSLLLTQLANLILLIFGIKPTDTEEEVTEEEIRHMVDIGSESGAIDPDEKEMIHNIFELDDTPIKDIMTHRTDTEFLWTDEKENWKDIISDTNHTIYPVCEESIDNIVGTLYTKDFYRTLLTGGDITSILRQPYFVPETIKADELFRQMQKTKTHFAVVLDEYGGLAGIITMSDLLEEIVGTLSNEYDDIEEDDIIKLDDNTYKISGSCDIDLVSETLGIELPLEEYNTFAGMILEQLGEIPEDGSTPELEAYGLAIKVTDIKEHRIESAKVTLLEKVQGDN